MGSCKLSSFSTISYAYFTFIFSNIIDVVVPPITPPINPPTIAPNIGTGMSAYPIIAPLMLDPNPVPAPISSFSNYLFLLELLADSLL